MIRTALLTKDETKLLRREDAEDERLGTKARGLLWLPLAWVPPFLVVNRDYYDTYCGARAQVKSAIVGRLADRIRNAFLRLDIGEEDELLIRSNAVRETAEHRGTYLSIRSSNRELERKLSEYFHQTASLPPADGMGLIIQRYIRPLARGYLSNQRRAAREYRDALAEIEFPVPGPIQESRLSFRRWRRTRPANEDALVCTSLTQLTTVLREPLIYAAHRQQRALFEWIWDGRVVCVVQADLGAEEPTGVSPKTLLQRRIASPPASLSRFHPATDSDDALSGKLRNHRFYEKNGFWQPGFFILSDDSTVKEIVGGTVGEALTRDLAALTESPLIVRTSIGDETVQLLPRSPILTSAGAATTWLVDELGPAVREAINQGRPVVLVAHHYIPAMASAFALAAPGREDVYIEAGWGIPEGLYYFPCDRYAVHTLKKRVEELGPRDYERFVVQRDIQWKSYFVAPDEKGNFVRHALGQPWDWKQVIQDEETFGQIGEFTRRIAEHAGKHANVMWFLDCNTAEGHQKAIPWYHELQDDDPPAMVLQRNSRDKDVVVSNESDVDKLENRALEEPRQPGRLVVRLSPSQDLALRNLDFAKRVGVATKRLDGIVVLEGARLSHVYYALRRTGVTMSVRSPQMRQSLLTDHLKLVRDRIPDKVLASGEVPELAELAPHALLAALKMKLVEEAFEARDANAAGLREELADVLEVVWALASVAGVPKSSVERARKSKAGTRGGFAKGRFLIATGTSGRDIEASLVAPFGAFSPNVKTTRHTRPLETATPGPADRRSGVDWVEFVQNITVALTYPEWRVESPGGSLMLGGIAAEAVEWTLEGQRHGPNLRLRLKIRVGPEQLELPFEWPGQDEREE